MGESSHTRGGRPVRAESRWHLTQPHSSDKALLGQGLVLLNASISPPKPFGWQQSTLIPALHIRSAREAFVRACTTYSRITNGVLHLAAPRTQLPNILWPFPNGVAPHTFLLDAGNTAYQ
jgi:hypothetical protein